jgi:NitT/TauT family transport system permease protein
MTRSAPILAVLALILGLWYLAVPMANIQWEVDQAARAGTPTNPAGALGAVLPQTALVLVNPNLIPATYAQERPVLPAPHQIVGELWKTTVGTKLTSKKNLVYHGLVTLTSTFWGFVVGSLLGIVMAVMITRSRTVEMGLMPWAIISQTIPVVAIAPMIVVLSNSAGLGEHLGVENRLVSKVIIAAYLSYFPVLVGMIKGLRSPDPMQLDLLKTYGASEGQGFFKLRLPASVPYLFASLKVGIAASLVGAIVGELPTGAVEGLGARMLVGSQFGSPIMVWAALFAAAILGGVLILVVRLAEGLVVGRMGVRA